MRPGAALVPRELGKVRGSEAHRVRGNERSHGKSEAGSPLEEDSGASSAPPLQSSFSLSRSPMVTGTSVLGVKFDGGVVIAADMLGSYGSLARFRNISRVMRVNDSTMLGASGDYADFQYLKQVLGQMV